MTRALVRFCIAVVLLIVISACASVASGPRLSRTEVRRLADARAKQICSCDLHEIAILEPEYVSADGRWVVAYHHKKYTRLDFVVWVRDKTKQVSVLQSDSGAFDGIARRKD